MEIEGYFVHYKQSPSRVIGEKNALYRITIKRKVEKYDQYALMKFFLWNRNPRTSRGTVTSVAKQGSD